MKPNADSRWREDEDGNLLMPRLQSEFLDWLVSPVKSPPSQAQWCVENDVHERTVQTWKRDIRFRREWEKRTQELNIDPDRIQDMVETLYMAGKNGDVKAAETYLKYVERFLPAPAKPVSDNDITSMSDEELDAAIAELV